MATGTSHRTDRLDFVSLTRSTHKCSTGGVGATPPAMLRVNNYMKIMRISFKIQDSFENSPLLILRSPSYCESEITVKIHGIKKLLSMDKNRSSRHVIVMLKVIRGNKQKQHWSIHQHPYRWVLEFRYNKQYNTWDLKWVNANKKFKNKTIVTWFKEINKYYTQT